MCAICVVWNKQRMTKAELWRAIMETSLQTPTSEQTQDFQTHLNEVREQVESLQGDSLFDPPKK